MSGQEGAPPRPTVSRRSHVPPSRSESHRRSRSRDNRRRSSSTSEERHSSKGARRRDRSPSSSSKSSDCNKRTVKDPDSKNHPANSSKETNQQLHGDSKSRHDTDKYDKKSKCPSSTSGSRSRDRYSKKHSRWRNKSKSLDRRHQRGDSRNYSTDETSREESEDDIDGIGLDESPPPSWSTKKNKTYSYGSNYDGQYSQYQNFQAAPPAVAPFKNDGSFLEMFKKMQESQNKEKEQAAAEQSAASEIKKPPLSFIGKRRGGRVLKTGVVEKAKVIEDQTIEDAPKDAWTVYMQEVKKYREAKCDEEVKTRPLVK
ncbi:uncharacterized protein LOC143915365 isoform X1 [Arctopsyche grandis]|uniref:uncharacterized protein LOC143915365 isoform X1 n=1 Tax=Arctopsyche grandis TaxID=121162 RepID=UPI00406D8509